MGSDRVAFIDSLIEKAIRTVQDTCLTVPVMELLKDLAAESGETLTSKEMDACLYEFDNVVFNCVVCGWWFETYEHAEGDHDETICQNCVEE